MIDPPGEITGKHPLAGHLNRMRKAILARTPKQTINMELATDSTGFTLKPKIGAKGGAATHPFQVYYKGNNTFGMRSGQLHIPIFYYGGDLDAETPPDQNHYNPLNMFPSGLTSAIGESRPTVEQSNGDDYEFVIGPWNTVTVDGGGFHVWLEIVQRASAAGDGLVTWDNGDIYVRTGSFLGGVQYSRAHIYNYGYDTIYVPVAAVSVETADPNVDGAIISASSEAWLTTNDSTLPSLVKGCFRNGPWNPYRYYFPGDIVSYDSKRYYWVGFGEGDDVGVNYPPDEGFGWYEIDVNQVVP